jgi:hypothetical protein
VRGNLGGRFNVYKQPPLVSLAKQSMNAKPYQSRLVDDHIKQVNVAEEDSKLFWSALALGLGLLAALPTAGSSLAAGLAVAGAGVSAYQAYEHVMDASLQAAAAGSDMDKALAITQDEPNYLWLALDIVGVVMDVVAAGAAFKALRATMGASKLQDIASMQKLAGQCDAAKLSPIARGRVFASVMAEAGGDMTSTLEQMIQVFRQLKAPAGDAKVLEYAAKMAEEMIAEGKVITIRAGHEVEDVTEHLMRTGSPRQASGKALGYLDEFKPGTMGTYISGEDVILLRTNASPEMVASVFVHEITHRKQSAMELLDGFTKFEAELSAHASQREFMRLIPREAIPEQWRWLRDADDHVLHWAVAQTYKIPDEVVLGGRSAMWRAMRKEVRGRGL